jgi:hypothetical protein
MAPKTKTAGTPKAKTPTAAENPKRAMGMDRYVQENKEKIQAEFEKRKHEKSSTGKKMTILSIASEHWVKVGLFWLLLFHHHHNVF